MKKAVLGSDIHLSEFFEEAREREKGYIMVVIVVIVGCVDIVENTEKSDGVLFF